MDTLQASVHPLNLSQERRCSGGRSRLRTMRAQDIPQCIGMVAPSPHVIVSRLTSSTTLVRSWSNRLVHGFSLCRIFASTLFTELNPGDKAGCCGSLHFCLSNIVWGSEQNLVAYQGMSGRPKPWIGRRCHQELSCKYGQGVSTCSPGGRHLSQAVDILWPTWIDNLENPVWVGSW